MSNRTAGEGREEVAVALANWNGMKFIGRCLESIFVQTWGTPEVVIADNGSTDGSKEWIQQHYPQVKLLENMRNEGFAVGYNQAIAACGKPFILILNTDVFLASNFIEQALKGFAQGACVGSVTGRIYQEATKETISGGFFLRRQIRILHSSNIEEEDEVFGTSGAVTLFSK